MEKEKDRRVFEKEKQAGQWLFEIRRKTRTVELEDRNMEKKTT